MAIAYTTGTINQPDSGSVGLAMADKIRDDIVAHTAWELVEEYSPASPVVAWTVFKCLASSSNLLADFFVVMGRTLANGELRFCVCENYNPATHVMSGFPTGVTTSTYLFDASGRRSETFTLANTPLASGNTTPFYNSWIPSGTSTKWWLTVADDGFTVAFNGPSNGYVHIGAYTPLAAMTVEPPLMVMGSSSGYGGITRNPSVAGVTIAPYALSFLAGNNSVSLGFRGDLRYNDRLQDNQRPVAEVGMVMTNAPGGDYFSQYGSVLGKHKRMRWGLNTAPGFTFGDAYALGGTLWVPYLPTDSILWDTGVASA